MLRGAAPRGDEKEDMEALKRPKGQGRSQVVRQVAWFEAGFDAPRVARLLHRLQLP